MGALLHFIRHYGYLGVFSSLMLGMFGLPVPDESILTFTGFLISRASLQPLPALLAAYLGSICGITLNYLVGRGLGGSLLTKYGRRLGLTAEKMERVHQWFEKYGKWALILGYFLPGLRHLMAFGAGTARLRYRNFAPFAYTGGLLWVVAFVSLGYFLGEEWSGAVSLVRRYLWVVVGLVLGLGLADYWRRKRRAT